MKRQGTISWKLAAPTETPDDPLAGSARRTERSCTPRTVYGLCVAGVVESAAIASGAAIVNADAVNMGLELRGFMARSVSLSDFFLWLSPRHRRRFVGPNVGWRRKSDMDGWTGRTDVRREAEGQMWREGVTAVTKTGVIWS